MKILKYFFIFLVLIGSTLLGSLFFLTHYPLIDFSALEHYNPGKPSIVYDENGEEWARFQLDKREIISLNEIPRSVINAFLAAEDWNFFSHNGISFKGIIRSIIINICKRKKAQGASTITQQLVRLLFFDSNKNFIRKIKEQVISIIVEFQFTKEQILEVYLNHVYFGCGIYGIQAACQRFFNKNVSDIDAGQAATLAGILRNPQKYCPLLNKENSQNRRNVILGQMFKLKFINETQYKSEIEKNMEICQKESEIIAPHLKENLRIYLEELVGKQKLYSGGLKIQTTININMQKTAEKVFKRNIKNYKEKITSAVDGALISLEGSTGAIKALVGGYDYQKSQFNRALHAKRQLGSTFKPILFATAIANGLTFANTEIDEPLTILDNNQEWNPQNFNHKFLGEMTLAQALALSNNIISVKTLLKVGIEKAIDMAKKCGIQGNIVPYPSIALGCVESTALEAVTMFNVFSQHGILVEPYYIVWIKDEWDTKIYKHNPSIRQVLSPCVSDQLLKVLSISIDRFKKRVPNHGLKFQAMGKTGTTNDARTCWYTGASPQLTTCVYLGCDDNSSLGTDVLASRTAFPIWLEYNKAVGSTEKNFRYDPRLKETLINANTGQLTDDQDIDAISILMN